MDNLDSKRKQKSDIDFFKIGYAIVIAIPIILVSFYLIEFELNQPFEFPVIWDIHIDENLDVDVRIYNNARNNGVAKEDEIIILLKYMRDPKKHITISPIIYLEKGSERIWERTLRPDEPIFDDSILYYSKRIPMNETGLTTLGIDTQYFKITGGEFNKSVKVFHGRMYFLVQSLSELEQRESNRIIWIGLITSSVIGCFTIIALITNTKISKSQARVLLEQKQIMDGNLKLSGLNLVFQKFNEHKSREARRKILSAYHDYLIEHDFPIEYTHDNFLKEHPQIDLVKEYPDLQVDVENIKSDFEEVAVMEKNGLLDKEAYFDAFYGMMLRCYGALRGNIENARDKSGTRHYTTYFEKQSVDAVEYWKNNHPKSTIKYYGQERTDFTLQRFRENIWKIRIIHPQSNIQNCTVFCEKASLRSSKYNDNDKHTIETGAGDNFEMPKEFGDNPIIIIKSNNHIIKRIRFLDIEEVQP